MIGRLDIRLNDQAIRLDQHAAYWQLGRRWSVRFEQWSERVNKAIEIKDQQIAELSKRNTEIERRLPPQ
jgi:hypothetical protein